MIDLMIKEYPSKHSEYSVILQERERQRIAKEYSVSTRGNHPPRLRPRLMPDVSVVLWQQMQQQNPQKVEASKVPEYIKKAAKKAAEFNSNFNRERMEERRAYFDLQTHVRDLDLVARVHPRTHAQKTKQSSTLWTISMNEASRQLQILGQEN